MRIIVIIKIHRRFVICATDYSCCLIKDSQLLNKRYKSITHCPLVTPAGKMHVNAMERSELLLFEYISLQNSFKQFLNITDLKFYRGSTYNKSLI